VFTGIVYRSEESFIVVWEVTTVSGGGGVGLFGRGLFSRIVIASLMMTGCCGGVLGQMCAEGEFYDAVVDACALCSDVCDLCLSPQSTSFCARNCPGAQQY